MHGGKCIGCGSGVKKALTTKAAARDESEQREFRSKLLPIIACAWARLRKSLIEIFGNNWQGSPGNTFRA